ncbi:MAG TPA: multiheme c-type cytochrome [Myxococcales bacterium]
MSPAVPRRRAIRGVVLTALAVALVYAGFGFAAARGGPGAAVGDEYFGLSRTRTGGGRLVPAAVLGNSDYCGACHLQIFHEWDASSHHFSSFNNPYYRRVAEATRERRGPEAVRFCAGCHDPLPLVSGELERARSQEGAPLWSQNAGITCLACHRITEIHGGNGGYTLSAPVLHPFAFSENQALRWVHETLVRLTPSLHRAALSKPFYASAEYCATCHQLTSPRALNGHADVKLQDEHGDWKQSRFAAHGDGAKSCSGCHMPLVPSDDPAARKGVIHSHRFTGGNTALPALNRDDEQLQATEAFLRGSGVEVRCAAALSPGGPESPCEEFRASPGDEVLLRFEVQNGGVGHGFPGGTADSNEAWLALEIADARKRPLLVRGMVEPDLAVGPGAHFFRATALSMDGQVLDRRTATTEAVRLLRDSVLAAGARARVEYRFTVPRRAAFPLGVTATLNWRKFSPELTRWVFAGDDAPELPITVIGRAAVEIGRR